MADTHSYWQQEVLAHHHDDADDVIETINDLLQQNAGEVLRQVTNELTLCLRAIGNLVQKIEHETDPAVKAAILFKMMDEGQEKPVNVENFKTILNDHVVESRQMVDLLAVYAMALSEQQSSDT